MKDLNKQALIGLLRLFGALAAWLFIPVWTFHYWQAWVLLIAFFSPATAITVYLMKHDTALLERRLKGRPGAEKQAEQKTIQLCIGVLFTAMFIVPSLDHRFMWSELPSYVVAVGDALVVAGFTIVFFVFRVNSFASAIIETGEGQDVISTGPYAFVRHPMYSGALVLLAGIPLALGSAWGLCLMIPMTLALAWRSVEEEKFLIANLRGYAEYQMKVKFRLLPSVW